MKRVRSPFLVEGISKKRIEMVMSEFLGSYMPDHLLRPGPLNVEKLIDRTLYVSHGYQLGIVENLPTSIEAKCIFGEKMVCFTQEGWDSVCAGDPRKRFTASHETVHVILHSSQANQISMARNTGNTPIYFDPEWQADYGAGSLLMPRETIVSFINNLVLGGASAWDIVSMIQNTYNVSESAAETRLSVLRKDGFIAQSKSKEYQLG